MIERKGLTRPGTTTTARTRSLCLPSYPLTSLFQFPDSVSDRAARHVSALAALAQAGHRCTVVLIVQRADVRHGGRPSDFHDPTFAAAARAAGQAGVRFRAVRSCVSLDGSTLDLELPVDLEPYNVAPIGRYWEANRPTTGWVRSASGGRVANGPFAHHKASGRQTKAAVGTARKEETKQKEQKAARAPDTAPASSPKAKKGRGGDAAPKLEPETKPANDGSRSEGTSRYFRSSS